MTVVALVRGKHDSYNAIFVDTGAVRADGQVFRQDKLHRAFGDTFVTCIGEASILRILLSRMNGAMKRPNLRDASFISSVYGEFDAARASGVLLSVPTAFSRTPTPSTTLAVCNRAEAFFWKVEFDGATAAHSAAHGPTYLPPDSMCVFRGVSVVTLEQFTTMDAGEAESMCFDQMLNVNNHLEAAGADRLPYDLERRVSGVVLPHRTSDNIMRAHPGLPTMDL